MFDARSMHTRISTPFGQTDTVAGAGYGNPVRPVGLIVSIFRPSDDATVFSETTTAATIPLALDEVIEKGMISSESTLMFLGLGSGLTWGACVYRFQ